MTGPALSLAAACLVLPLAVHAGEMDTEHLFAFTIGTDVGDPGDKELEGSLFARLGKRQGSYAAGSQQLEIEYVPVHNLRLSGGPIAAYHDLRGVEGLEDRRQGEFQGFSFDVRYQLADRSASPFGLAVDIEPRWSRVDDISGAPIDQYGVDLTLAVDRELIANRLVAALNLLWQPDGTRARPAGTWSNESTLGAAGALMAKIGSGLFLGGEARYLRSYDSIGADHFEGHAFFLGPSVFANLSERCWLALGWSMQLAGRSVDDPAMLDLVRFERHQVRLNFGVNF
jgi:hypothetical protein